MSDAPRGTCRGCGRTFTLTKRGDVRAHKTSRLTPSGRQTNDCSGAGQEPKEHLRMGRDYTPADVFRALGEPVPPFWQANRGGGQR